MKLRPRARIKNSQDLFYLQLKNWVASCTSNDSIKPKLYCISKRNVLLYVDRAFNCMKLFCFYEFF